MNAFLPAFRIFEFPAEMKKYGLSNAILQAQPESRETISSAGWSSNMRLPGRLSARGPQFNPAGSSLILRRKWQCHYI
jgi:hypothetical protein